MFPLQVIINGIIIGSIYSLVTVGFCIMYQQLRFINLFHGALYLISSYLIYAFFSFMGLHFLLSNIFTIIIVLFLSLIVTNFFFIPFSNFNQSASILLIFSFVLLILSQNIIILFFYADPKVINYDFLNTPISINSIKFIYRHLFIFFLSIVIIFMLFLLLYKTKTGIKMRAVSDNSILSEIKGINSKKMIMISSGISSFLASVSGSFNTLECNIEPNMGFVMVFKAITATILGGGNIHGAILGAFIIGILENISVWYFPSGFKNLITFTLLILIMFFKSKDIFETKFKREKTG